MNRIHLNLKLLLCHVSYITYTSIHFPHMVYIHHIRPKDKFLEIMKESSHYKRISTRKSTQKNTSLNVTSKMCRTKQYETICTYIYWTKRSREIY